MFGSTTVSNSDLIALAMSSRKRVKKVEEGKRTYKMTDSDWNKVVQDKSADERPVMTKARQDYSKNVVKKNRKLAKAKAPGDSILDINARVYKR